MSIRWFPAFLNHFETKIKLKFSESFNVFYGKTSFSRRSLLSAPEVDEENSETNISRTDAARELGLSSLERGQSGVYMYSKLNRSAFS